MLTSLLKIRNYERTVCDLCLLTEKLETPRAALVIPASGIGRPRKQRLKFP